MKYDCNFKVTHLVKRGRGYSTWYEHKPFRTSTYRKIFKLIGQAIKKGYKVTGSTYYKNPTEMWMKVKIRD